MLHYSFWEGIPSGPPQESILGPLPYNIFLCDIFLIMKDFGSYPDNNSPYKKGESLDDIIQALESCYYPRLSTKESIEFHLIVPFLLHYAYIY